MLKVSAHFRLQEEQSWHVHTHNNKFLSKFILQRTSYLEEEERVQLKRNLTKIKKYSQFNG